MQSEVKNMKHLTKIITTKSRERTNERFMPMEAFRDSGVIDVFGLKEILLSTVYNTFSN